MGLMPSQELRYARYDFFIVYKGDERIGVCSNLEIERLERFFPNHCFVFEHVSADDWVDEFQLAKINDPNYEMPEFSSDEVEPLVDWEEIKKLLEK